MESHTNPLFFFLQDLYTAATVLLMARLFPKIRDVIGEGSLLTSWNECLDCLHEYQSYGESAKKCYEYLSELDKHVWTATSNGKWE